MNDLDALMSEDPLKLSNQDIDSIIAYQRKIRAQAESGVKPKKETGPKVSLDKVMANLVKPKVVEGIKRRV